MCLHVKKYQFPNYAIPGLKHHFYKIVSPSYKSPCWPSTNITWQIGNIIKASGEPYGPYIEDGALHLFVTEEDSKDYWVFSEQPDARIMVCEVDDGDIIAWGMRGDVAVKCCTVIREIQRMNDE